MAITNAQQYQQLVNKPANGKRPGYRGEAAYGPTSRSNQATSMRAATSSRSVSPGGGNSRRGGDVNLGDGQASPKFRQSAPPGGQDPSVYGVTGKQYDPDKALAAATKVALAEPKGILKKIPSTLNLTRGVINNLPFIKPQLIKNRLDYVKSQFPQYYDEEEGLVNLPANLQALYDQGKLNTNEALEAIQRLGTSEGVKSFEDFMFEDKGSPSLKFSGNVGGLGTRSAVRDADGNIIGYKFSNVDKDGNIIGTGGEGGGAISDYERRLLELEQAVAAAAETPEVEEDQIINYRLMADGGLTNDAPVYEGGIMDIESARQMYGLGKLVKKATRAVKKIAKSPIGKAALLAGGAGLFGFGPAKGLAGSPFGLGLKDFMSFGNVDKAFDVGSKSFKLGSMFSNPLVSIGIPTALSYLMTPEEEEEQQLALGADIADPRYIMNNPSLYTNRRLAAEGGSMDEPVAKKTMPLLDMDGKEMDLRDEGGFVPLGRMERADDVPARLSKNEFVFTADAVRNAGEGDVDKGAEVMYNMMKNLEAGGEVSEESQGLEGAREMFQTSQRLEEVI